MKKLGLMFLCWSLGWTLVQAALDPFQELAALQKAYQTQEACHYKMTYQLFDAQTNALLETQHADVLTQGKDYHFRLSDVEYLYRKGKLVWLNHAEKTMLYFSNGKTSGDLLTSNPLQNLSEQKGYNAKVETVAALQRKLVLELPDKKVLSIYYSPIDYTIERVESLVRHPNFPTKPMLLSIQYEVLKRGQLPFSTQLDKYVVQNKKVVVATPAYKHYRFNQIQ
jgi:hypothetical protein